MSQLPEPSKLRISDADRHKVAELLREAAGDGRLDLDELDQRLEATWTAKTYADLVPITADLPGGAQPSQPAVRRPPAAPANLPVSEHGGTFAIMGGSSRAGIWKVPETHTVFAMMGGIDIDLRQAVFSAHETVIYANTIWGGIDIVVNAHTHVIVDGVGIMGAFDQIRDKVPAELDESSPVVRIKGFALMGGVGVIRRAMPGEEPPRRGILHRGPRG